METELLAYRMQPSAKEAMRLSGAFDESSAGDREVCESPPELAEQEFRCRPEEI